MCVHIQSLSHVQLSATSWTVARQAPLSMDFPGKNTRVGWYFLFLGISPTQGSNLRLLHWQTGSLLLRWILFDNSSFYRWGNWGTENLNKFPKVQRTQEKPQQICARPVAVTREQSPVFLRNSNGKLDLPGPTQEAAWIRRRNSRIPP